MQPISETTKFAPAERADEATIYRQAHLLLDQKFLGRLFESVMNAVVILNSQRQIVYGNRHFAELTGCNKPSELYGLRLGEAIDCLHSEEESEGCGTAEACAVCGAVNAVLEAQHGEVAIQEAHIRKRDGKPDLHIEVKASPYHQDKDLFIIVAMSDISDRVRRGELERIFFHDLMNTASGLKMMSEELPEESSEAHSPSVKSQLLNGFVHLIEEIKEQRSLLAAETGDLQLVWKPCRSAALLREVTAYFKYLEVGEGKEIIIHPHTVDLLFETDRTLVFRVLGNMLKNALEATPAGESVTLCCRQADGGVEFSVHNPGVMPLKVQFQMFHRSFSTKGAGRGIGTYSMKLLTENYLGGRIFFSSSKEQGTCFRAWYPFQPDCFA